jgi:hypothetical protein
MEDQNYEQFKKEYREKQIMDKIDEELEYKKKEKLERQIYDCLDIIYCIDFSNPILLFEDFYLKKYDNCITLFDKEDEDQKFRASHTENYRRFVPKRKYNSEFLTKVLYHLENFIKENKSSRHDLKIEHYKKLKHLYFLKECGHWGEGNVLAFIWTSVYIIAMLISAFVNTDLTGILLMMLIPFICFILSIAENVQNNTHAKYVKEYETFKTYYNNLY